MGGLVIETIRPGVQFIPDAAAAFRRAEAQTQREFGRNIGVNSTWRSWSKQMSMHNAWNAYEAGRGPYPGHSKAVHPSESFHVDGTAVDSDDWRNARIVQILAENGFIRNRLYVPNEEHHFEWIKSRDKNYGKKVDRMSAAAEKKINAIHDAIFKGGKSMQDGGRSVSASLARIAGMVGPINRDGKQVALRQEVADTKTMMLELQASQAGLEAALTALANAKGLDPDAILKAAQQGVERGLRNVTFTADIDG